MPHGRSGRRRPHGRRGSMRSGYGIDDRPVRNGLDGTIGVGLTRCRRSRPTGPWLRESPRVSSALPPFESAIAPGGLRWRGGHVHGWLRKMKVARAGPCSFPVGERVRAAGPSLARGSCPADNPGRITPRRQGFDAPTRASLHAGGPVSAGREQKQVLHVKQGAEIRGAGSALPGHPGLLMRVSRFVTAWSTR